MCMAPLVLIGARVFSRADNSCVIVPTSERIYPTYLRLRTIKA